MAEGTKVTVAPAAPAKAVPGAKAAEKEKS
jgi:hypothetical protein